MSDCVLANAGRLYPAEVIGDQDHYKQQDRKADAQSQCLHSTIAFTFVFHQKYQCGTQAGENQDEGDGDENFHDVCERAGIYIYRSEALL